MRGGSIPSKELAKIVDPITRWDPRKNGGDGSFQYIDIASVSRTSKRIEGTAEILCCDAPSRARQRVRANDVLVSTVRPNLNAVALVGSDHEGATASTGFTVLRASTGSLDPRYLYYWVRASDFVAYLVERATGASYPAVSDPIVKSARIPLPPLDEQRRIAAILDQADALRRKRREAIQLTEELLRSAFLEMFGDPVTNPKGWPIVELATVAEIQGGLQVSHKRSVNPIEVPYLRVANVYRGRLDLAEIKEMRVTSRELARVRLIRGDLLFVEGHGNPDEIGRAAVWDGAVPDCVHQNHLIRVRLKPNTLLPEFVGSLVNSDAGRRQLQRMGKTTSGLNTLSSRQIRSLRIMVPPIEDQEAFARFAAKLNRVASTLEQDRLQASNLFNSLVQRAFRGEL